MPKVIGAGFGRTGTLSLKAALETLGFHKCYHMQEVSANPRHAKIWAASRGWPADEDVLFHGYWATVDWPACTFYRVGSPEGLAAEGGISHLTHQAPSTHTAWHHTHVHMAL
jgi:hypothetical protein